MQLGVRCAIRHRIRRGRSRSPNLWWNRNLLRRNARCSSGSGFRHVRERNRCPASSPARQPESGLLPGQAAHSPEDADWSPQARRLLEFARVEYAEHPGRLAADARQWAMRRTSVVLPQQLFWVRSHPSSGMPLAKASSRPASTTWKEFLSGLRHSEAGWLIAWEAESNDKPGAPW